MEGVDLSTSLSVGPRLLSGPGTPGTRWTLSGPWWATLWGSWTIWAGSGTGSFGTDLGFVIVGLEVWREGEGTLLLFDSVIAGSRWTGSRRVSEVRVGGSLLLVCCSWSVSAGEGSRLLSGPRKEGSVMAVGVWSGWLRPLSSARGTGSGG